jgi:hypothetical protein
MRVGLATCHLPVQEEVLKAEALGHDQGAAAQGGATSAVHGDGMRSVIFSATSALTSGVRYQNRR